MNIVVLTQGANIDIFLKLRRHLEENGANIGKVGALVSYARHFEDSEAVKSLGGNTIFLKEWEIVKKALQKRYDADDLKKRESFLSPGSVWSAIIGDRRLIYGRRAKFTQDYRVHFSDAQLWAMAYEFMLEFDRLLEEVKPDVIIGFTPVTFGELLGLEIAASRNIPTLQLHSSRIRNFFALHDVVSGTSRHFLKLMEQNKFKAETLSIAKEIIAETTQGGLIYEGANTTLAKGRKINLSAATKELPGVVKAEILKFKNPAQREDHHDPGYLMPWFYRHLSQPLREKWVKQRLLYSGRSVLPEQLSGIGEYCFFPLQSEPEVSLQVLGRPYHKNQIELLRNLGASLPAGMKMLVKEHPRSFGLRPWSWYKSLLEIPNLYFIDAPSLPVVKQASFVGVISGTIGFEAIMMGKPVLLLGHPKYEDIGGNMTRKCYNLFDLPEAVRCLLDEYQFDESEIERFLCALIEGSVNIDLYSNLLKKPGRKSFQDGQVSDEQDLQKLALYMIQRIKEVSDKAPKTTSVTSIAR